MSTIKISELATSAISLTDLFAKADANGIANKNTVQGLSNFLNTVGTLAFRGVLLAADAAVTLDGVYVAGDAGTYTNNGGLVITVSNQIVLISITGSQTVFEKVEIPITLTIDATPTEGSANALQSGGTYTFINDSISTKSDLESGKNLIDKSNLFIDKYIDYTSGNVSTAAGYSATDFILINESTNYHVNIGDQIAFYDANKTYISGLLYNYAFTSPASAVYLKTSLPTTTKDIIQLELGSTETIYEPYEFSIKTSQIPNLLSLKSVSKNKLSLEYLKSGFYVDYSNGNNVGNASFSTTEKQVVLPSTEYTLSMKNNFNGSLEQFAIYQDDGTYIVGHIPSGFKYTFTTPANAGLINFSIRNTTINDNFMLEIGGVESIHEPYDISVPTSKIQKGGFSSQYLNNDLRKLLNLDLIITCRKTGGDFDTLRYAAQKANSIATADIPVTILMGEGVFDIFTQYTNTEINSASFYGLELSDYVSLKVEGNIEDTEIKGFLNAATYDAAAYNRVSTIVKKGTGTIENCYITGYNVQYCVHDDYQFNNLKRKYIDCDIYKLQGDFGGLTNGQAIGQGTFSDDEVYFENCRIRTEMGNSAFTSHNNVTFAKPSKLTFVNTSFESPNFLFSTFFTSLQSGVTSPIVMNGCRFSGFIRIHNDLAGAPIEYSLEGVGNDAVPIFFDHTHATLDYSYNFQGETIKLSNRSGSTILRGDLVKQDNANLTRGIEKLGVSDDIDLVVGVAMLDSLTGTTCLTRFSGYLPINATNLVGLSVGDRIGVTSGVLAVVTSSDYLGTVVTDNFILLK